MATPKYHSGAVPALIMDPSTGSYLPASGEIDANGNLIIRTMDAAPWAYDPTNDLLKTSVARRESVTIQTHNAVNVASSSSNVTGVQTAIGFDSIAVGIKSDVSHARHVDITWVADIAGNTSLGNEAIIVGGPSQYGVGRLQVKAPYFRVSLSNDDAAAAHTISTWTTLIP